MVMEYDSDRGVAHCRKIVDNNVDMAHFFYIHHAYPTYFKNVTEGHIASQFMESKALPDAASDYEKLWDGTKLRSEAAYFGPAYMINCHYPVTHDSFLFQVDLVPYFQAVVMRVEGLDRWLSRAFRTLSG